MKVFSKVRQEIDELSKWFKIGTAIIFIIYVSFWLFSINISNFQTSNRIKPILPVLAQDSEGYYNLAESLINGDGFSQNGKPETLRTPGYPLFVAVIKTLGMSYFAVTLIQILLVFGSALIIRKVGIFFASKKAGEIASLLFLINPVTLSLSLVILTDTLFLFLCMLGLYLTISISNARLFLKVLVVSAVFTFAIYTRLGLFALPIFIVPILVLDIPLKSKLKFALSILALILLSISPWILRNYIRVGVAGYTSFRSQNLGWAATKFLSSVNHTNQSVEQQNFLDKINIKSSDYYDIRYSGKIGKAAEEIIFSRPFSYLKYHLTASLPFLFPSSVLYALDTYNSALDQKSTLGQEGAITLLAGGKWGDFWKGIMQSWWKVLERLCWLAAYIASISVIWEYRKKAVLWVFLFIIGYLMLLAGPASGPRYSFQAMPFIFILFASAGVSIFHRMKKII